MPRLSDTKSKKESDSRSNDAIKKFRRLGFSKLESPEFDEPRMPGNITSLKVTELGDLMSKYAAWREYADEQVSLAIAEYTAKQQDYDFSYAKEYLSLPELAKETEKSKERKLLSQDNIQTQLQELTQAEMYKELLSAKQESYNNAIFVISREFTRRGQTFDSKH